MSHIFISYSRKDLAIAEKVINALAEDNFEPWIDWKSIPKGEQFWSEIQQGIEEADVFLFLVSPDSVRSDWCNREIDHAVKNGKRILPIVIRNTDPKIIQPEISNRNWVFCREDQDDFNKAIEEMRKTIHTDYEWLKFHTELQVKAIRWERKKDNSRLLRGRELREAEQQVVEVSVQEDPQPTPLQRRYIFVSQKNVARVRRQVVASLAFGLGIVVVLAVFAWIQRNTAVTEASSRATAEANASAEANARATALANEENARTIAQEEKTRAEEQANIAIARQISAQANALFATGNSEQMIAVLLATQSMRIFPIVDAAQILQNNQLAYIGPRMAHDRSVNSAAFSPNGKYIVSGSWDYTARVWEVETGKEIARVLHDESVTSVAFSSDGKYVASGSADKTIRIWEAITGKEIVRLIHDGAVTSVAFSPDGNYTVSGSEDNTARVWEVSTGRESARMTHGDWVNMVAFSLDGKYVVSSGCDQDDPVYYCVKGSARVWEPSTGKEIFRTTHESEVWSAAFSPDGKYLASVGDYLRIWEILPGKELARMTHDGNVITVAFSPDGKYVASGSADKTARVWNISNGTEVTRFIHDEIVLSVAFSSDGEYVASGSWDFTARVWEATTGKEVARMTHDHFVDSVAFSRDGKNVVSVGDDIVRVWKVLPRNKNTQFIHDDRVYSVAFNTDGKYVISGSHDHTARVWEVSTGMEVARMTHDAWVTSVAFSPDGKYAISGSDDATARVWEVSTGREITRMTHGYRVNSVAFSSDGKHVVSAGCDESDEEDVCQNGSARVWEALIGKEVARMTFDNAVNSVAFSPDGKYVISGGCDESNLEDYCINGSARVWEALTGKEIRRFTHRDRINSVAFSPDGKYASSGSGGEFNDSSACIWKISTTPFSSWECIVGMGVVNSVAFSPDGKYVVAGSNDYTARLWEALAGNTGKTLTGNEVARLTHDDGVNSVAFSPDGKYIVSGSWDHTARVWESRTGKEVFRITHDGVVYMVAFSPDGKFLASGSWDNTIRVQLWQPEDLIADTCLRLPRNLTREEWIQHIGDALPYQAICPNLPIEP